MNPIAGMAGLLDQPSQRRHSGGLSSCCGSATFIVCLHRIRHSRMTRHDLHLHKVNMFICDVIDELGFKLL